MRNEMLASEAAAHGWTVKPHGPNSWWTYQYTRGAQRILTRWKNGRLTSLTIFYGSGEILHVQRNKLATFIGELTSTAGHP